MKINFKNLIIDNFLSIGHAEISLENRGIVSIEGVNNSTKDNALSNGAGKSTIFNALCYALTGETIQGISSNLKNIFNEGEMKIELTFSINQDNFKVIRSRDKNKPNLKFYVNDEDKSGKGLKESEEQLNKYIPYLTSELLGEVIIIGQGMPHKFSDNTPSGRKEILEKLSNNDLMLYDIKDKVDKRLNKLIEKKNALTISKTENETKYKMLESQIKDQESKLNKLKEDSNVNFDELIKESQDNINKYQEEKNKLIEELNIKENKYKEDQDIQISLINKQNKELDEERKVFKEHNDIVVRDLADRRADLRALNENINKMSSIRDICPTCGQKIKGVTKPDLTPYLKDREKLEKSIEQYTKKDNEQKEALKYNLEDIKNRYKKELEDIKNSLDEQTKVNSELRKKVYDNSLIDNETSKLNKLKSDKEIIFSKIKDIEDTLKNLKTSLNITNTALLYNIKEINDLQNHLDVVNKISNLVKRDFRGILLSNVISYIDKKMKEYAKDIFNNDDIEFKLDGNNINITYLTKPLENLSGGEKQKVDLIIQFAIRSMMQEYTGFNSNIIVLDEILDFLDARGCDEVINFITNRLSDIESIFIITHHADELNTSNDSRITVVKNKSGVSYINEE